MKKVLIYALAGFASLGALSASMHAAAAASGATTAVAAEADDDDLQFTPYDVSDYTVEWNIAENRFDISMVAPTKESYSDYFSWGDDVIRDLTSIEKIVVTRSSGYAGEEFVVHTFENPAPGATLTCSDAAVEVGTYYDFSFTVYASGTSSDGVNRYNVLAGAVPAQVENVKVSTVRGQMPVTVTFTTPSTYADSEIAIASLTKVELLNYRGYFYDDELLETLSDIQPGTEYTLTVNNPDVTGAQSWKLIVYNEVGSSAATQFDLYIGEDTPGRVANLTAYENADGNILVSWDAPEAGAYNGWFDTSTLAYTVAVKTSDNSVTVVSENQSECNYVYDASAQSDPTRVAFVITASNSAGSGPETSTGYIILGPPETLPFHEGFDTPEGQYSMTYDHLWSFSTDCASSWPPEWSVSSYAYVGNDKVEPVSGEGGLLRLGTYSSTPKANFWLTSSKIDVAAARALEVSFMFYVPAASARGESIGIEISYDGGATYAEVIAVDLAAESESGWRKFSAVTTCPAGATTASLRIVARNTTDGNDFVVDDVTVKSTDVPAVIYPASVTDFTAVKNADKTAIDIKLTAPALTHPSLGDVNGEPLASISRIVLGRQIGYGNDYVTIHTFDNPEPGAELTYSDVDLVQGGEYRYRALVYVGENCDYGNYTDEPVMVGQIPADATELTASSTRGAAPVVVSFRAPAVDNVGEPLEKLTGVIIKRYNNTTFAWDEIATLTENLVPGEVITHSDADVLIGNFYEYRVIMCGNAGNSYGVSCSVYVGPDEPKAPENVTATVGDDGKVTVTWTAPTGGVNGGYIDAEHLSYIIYRGNGYSDYDAVKLIEGVTETSFTDPTEFGDEQLVKYFVKAVSNGFVGYSSMSNTVLVGKPAQLPFIENFDTAVGDYVQADHGSWSITSSESAPVWAFASMAYFILEGQVVPVDEGAGLAYAYYGHYNSSERDDYLTSGNIDIEAAPMPALSFHVYGVPGYNHTLDVEVAFDGGEFTSLKRFAYESDFTEQGWQKHVLPVSKPEGAKTMQVRFHAHKGSYSSSVAIDNLRVDAEYSGIASTEAVSGVAVAALHGAIAVSGAASNVPVVIADMAGRVVYSSTGSCTVGVAAGVYVVRVGSTTVKLIVK